MTKITKTHTIKAKGDLNGKEMAAEIEVNGERLNLFSLPKDPSKLNLAFGQLGLTANQSQAFGLVRNFVRWKIKRMESQNTKVGFTEKDRKAFVSGWQNQLSELEDAFAMVKAGGKKQPKAATKPVETSDVSDEEAELLAFLRKNPAIAKALMAAK